MVSSTRKEVHMKGTTSRSLGSDRLTGFLQQTLGVLVEGYVVSLAELHCIKEERHQKEQLSLKQNLKVKDKVLSGLEEQIREKDNELAVVRKKLEKAEAHLMLANAKNQEMQNEKNRLLELEEQAESKRLEDELKKKDSELMARKVKVMNTSGQPVPMGRKQCWQCHHVSFTQSTHCEKCGIRDWWVS